MISALLYTNSRGLLRIGQCKALVASPTSDKHGPDLENVQGDEAVGLCGERSRQGSSHRFYLKTRLSTCSLTNMGT